MPVSDPIRLRQVFLLAVLLPAALYAGGPPPVFWLGGGGAPCNFSSLATAVGAVPDGAIINIAGNQAYDDTNVTINNRSLRLVGGWADCAGTPSSERVVLEGQPDANLPVIRIQTGATPRTVVLRRLHVRGGSRSGIEIAGALDVEMRDSLISDNVATSGGGVSIIGASPAQSTLTLTDTVIGRTADGVGEGNVASLSGGGIRCSSATVRMNRAQFRGNISLSVGGGLFLDACNASLFTTSPFLRGQIVILPGISVFEDNDGAFFGGAISAANGSVLQFDGAGAGAVIDGNTSSRGAGVYLTGSGTRLIGERVNIINNVAGTFGAGAYVDDGASLSLARGGDAPGICERGSVCSRIAGNRITSAGTVAGSAVQLAQGSLTLDQTEVTGNTTLIASQSTFLFSGESVVRLSNSLIHGNDAGPGSVVRMTGPDSIVNITASTMAGNLIGDTVVRIESGDSTSTLGLRNGIIWQPGTTIVDAQPEDTLVSVCMNAHENQSIDALDHDPGFRSLVDGDYQLRLDSLNVDACADPFAGAETFDLLGIPRPEDLGAAGSTAFDRGTYELTDLIFAHDFEFQQ